MRFCIAVGPFGMFNHFLQAAASPFVKHGARRARDRMRGRQMKDRRSPRDILSFHRCRNNHRCCCVVLRRLFWTESINKWNLCHLDMNQSLSLKLKDGSAEFPKGRFHLCLLAAYWGEIGFEGCGRSRTGVLTAVPVCGATSPPNWSCHVSLPLSPQLHVFSLINH